MKPQRAVQTTSPEPAAGVVLPYESKGAGEASGSLLKQVFILSMPVLFARTMDMLVGLNDTYLANHLPKHAADAGAAVGTITYYLWFIGLLTSSVGAGSTAIIARAKGARHRSLANSVCGQSMTASILIGLCVGAILFGFAAPIITISRVQGGAYPLALSYLRMLSVTLPFTMVMFIGAACLNGAGDTITPAIIMVLVDLINAVASFSLTRGWWGLPVMGFTGIALGTIIAYVSGGIMTLAILLSGRGGMRLFIHRLSPHWLTIKRLLRIGVPAGVSDFLGWAANIGVVGVINQIDPTNAASAAHMTTIKLESISFMTGVAFATAAATMVGTSLGMKNPRRATQSAYLAYAMGGGIMTFCGILMITLGRYAVIWLAPPDPHIIDLATRCLMITGFIQSGFAAALIFGGALRGAGDTMTVMVLNLSTIIGVRFVGVMIVGLELGYGLPAIWMVLAGELFLRGVLVYLRFLHGGWRKIQV